MKLTVSDSIELIKISGIAIAGLLLFKYGRDWLNPIGDSIEKASAAAGVALSDITAELNGNHRVEFAEAHFFLDEKYVSSDFTIDKSWKRIIIDSNPKTGLLFKALLDTKGRVRERYRHLVNGEVSAEIIKAIADSSKGIAVMLENKKVEVI